MRIGILALSHHAYKTKTFCKLLENEQITVISNKATLKSLKNIDIQNKIYKNKEKTWSKFFDEINNITKRLDAIITLTSHHSGALNTELTCFEPKCKWIAWMHYAGIYTSGKKNRLKNEIIKIRRYMNRSPIRKITNKIFETTEALLKPYPLVNADHIFVLKKEMKHFLKRKGWNTSVSVFVPTTYEKNNSNKSSRGIKVVIPGNVSQMRRNYIKVLKEFDSEIGKQNKNIVLELLGDKRKSGKQLRGMINDLSDRKWLKTHPAGRVSSVSFNRSLQSADLLLSPLQRKKISPLQRNNIAFCKVMEKVGMTTASAVIWDAIKYGKPVLVPRYYISEEKNRGIFFSYDGSENICKAIRNKFEKGQIEKMKKKSKGEAKKFTAKKQEERLRNIIYSAGTHN
jgi:hypothetical protein